MNVTLLGTSSAEGWPALFCGCGACLRARRLGGKDIRTRSSALIDGVLKIDLPPDIHAQVIKNDLDLRKLEAILFTHAHDDHCAAAELIYRGHYFTPEPLGSSLPVYGSSDVIDRVRGALVSDHEELDELRHPVALHVVREFTAFDTASYAVTPIRANHDRSQQCFNLIIRDRSGATLLYATDTGWYDDETWQYLSTCTLDGVVVEATRGMEHDGYEGHLNIPQVIEFRQKLMRYGSLRPDAPVVTTHHSHMAGLMHEEMQEIVAPHGIQIGYDGMSFHVTIEGRRSAIDEAALLASTVTPARL